MIKQSSLCLGATIDTRTWIMRQTNKNGAPPDEVAIAQHIARHWPALNAAERRYAETNCRPFTPKSPFIAHL